MCFSLLVPIIITPKVREAVRRRRQHSSVDSERRVQKGERRESIVGRRREERGEGEGGEGGRGRG